MKHLWIIDQLINQGVSAFCIAPGSRNAPLSIAAADHPKAKTYVHFDERGLGFFALGLAQGSKKPVAVIVTSGTAVGNLLPSIMEAYHSHTPLIILTADRPFELLDCGANQATDQIKIFSSFVHFQAQFDFGCPEAAIRSKVAHGCTFQGPVHFNCPFREPMAQGKKVALGTSIALHRPSLSADPQTVDVQKGLILIGKVDNPLPILDLAKRLAWPVFADILSGARLTPTAEQIRHLDIEPEFVLHFGTRLTDKQTLSLNCPWMHVSPHLELQDPAQRVVTRVQSDIKPFCSTFQAGTDPLWLPVWQQIDQEKKRRELKELAPLTEAHTLYHLDPNGAAVFLGASMPIRLADCFLFPKNCRGFFSNRGLSGIDGNIATAAGLAEGLQCPVIAFIGDQACLHDLNSFALLQTYPVQLIVSNNFGGGIFSHLPYHTSPHFERLFAAAHSWQFEGIAQMFNLSYEKWDGQKPLSATVSEFITSRKAACPLSFSTAS